MRTVNLDMTLIIVFLTGLSYGATYIYQRAFQAYYDLPTMFIDLNINTLTGTLFFLILGLILAFGTSSFVADLIFKIEDPTFFKDMPLGLLLGLSLFIVGTALAGGNLVAEVKETYMVVKQDKELFVVVTTYKDSLVLAPLDIKNESIKAKFHTIEMKDAKNTEIIHFEDGIKVEKLKSSKKLKKTAFNVVANGI